MPRATLKADIDLWDGKSKDAIARVYQKHGGRADFLADVIALIAAEPTQIGATWLLKHYFDEGGPPLDATQAKAVYAKIGSLVHWEAKLHVLQCMEHMPIPKGQVKPVEKFLRVCLAGEAKFVRAWAYSGFHELARQHPEFRPEASRILADALETETAGSVLARIRRKVQQGFS